ncbi:sugar kinase [Rhodovulum sp. 12E13]|uniref:sugar kinase n=1 Tax=Rhodovulum sp. 12E13 TaxID=2203891 RepID=UPI000E19ECF4|nr:sugar kinase [Rhodovulum sp. 12E13]RDC74753.1 sugar kinase [Rhodovulum sp. 12E13]
MGCQILCLGEPLVEFNQVGGTEWRQGFGGDVSNVAVAAARQGARAGIATRLGSDGFGRMLREMWAAEGVDAAAVEADAEAPTGLYFVTHGDEGHAFEYRRAGSAASRMTPGTLPRAAIEAAGILHLSGISQAISESARAATVAAMEAARASGARVSYDTNLRLALWPLDDARSAILDALSRADIALPGIDDARAVLGEDDPERIVAAIRDLGPGIVALTLGREGVLLADGETVTHVPGVAVEAVDATGAGDCFDGAFLARLALNDTALDAARYAAAAASLSTTGYGAVAPIPRPDAVRAALDARG